MMSMPGRYRQWNLTNYAHCTDHRTSVAIDRSKVGDFGEFDGFHHKSRAFLPAMAIAAI